MKDVKQFFQTCIAVAGLGLIIALSLNACNKTSDDLGQTPEAGTLTIDPSGIKILNLKGTYLEMGSQYGRQLKADIQQWANYYNTTWKANNPKMYNFITRRAFIEGNTLYMSPKIKDFLSGEVTTCGLSIRDVYILDECLAFDYMFSGDTSKIAGAACTFVGAFGAATGGHTIVGRNLDLQKPLAVRDYNSVITIMHPSNGDHKIATFGFVGFPQGYALMNLDNTVFTEYNTGNSADAGTNPYLDSRTMMDLAFDAVTEKSNTDAITTATYLKTEKLLSPAFFGVADKNKVYVVQRPIPADGIITQNSLGTCINGVTNIFLDSLIPGVSLTIYNASIDVDAPSKKLDTPARGMVRWLNLVRYFTVHSSALDVNSIKSIISTDIADSGVFIGGYEQPGTNTFCEDDATFGSIVVDLSDLTKVNWLRYDYATKNKTWDMIDLTPYL